MQRRDDNELGMMEAVVTKMSRIIAHVGIGEKGKHVVQQLQVCFCTPSASSLYAGACICFPAGCNCTSDQSATFSSETLLL